MNQWHCYYNSRRKTNNNEKITQILQRNCTFHNMQEWAYNIKISGKNQIKN